MNVQQEISKRLMEFAILDSAVSAPALQNMLRMARSPVARPLDEEVVVNPAGEILRIWSTRMRIAASAHRRIEGASALVESLSRLAPEHPIEQMSLKDGRQLGIVFFDAKTLEPLGAIVKPNATEGETREGRSHVKSVGRSVTVRAKAAGVGKA
jgi:hypothetical protein